MRKALGTLPWVEQDSIQTDVDNREVRFNLKDKKAPDMEAVKKMGKYNEELQKAGVLLALGGLTPPSAGARSPKAGESAPLGGRHEVCGFETLLL